MDAREIELIRKIAEEALNFPDSMNAATRRALRRIVQKSAALLGVRPDLPAVIPPVKVFNTVNQTPSLTPLEAMTRILAGGTFSTEGFRYQRAEFDPTDESPLTTRISDGVQFMATGEAGTPVEASDTWVLV